MHSNMSPICPKKLRAARTGAQSKKAVHWDALAERFGPFAMGHPVERSQRQARAMDIPRRLGCGRGGSAGGRGGFGYGGGFGFVLSPALSSALREKSRVRKSHHDMARHPVGRSQRHHGTSAGISG
jgi:hypothetical protein